MRAEAFGEIGLLPDVFYRMLYSDYLLLKKGFENKRLWDQVILGTAVTKLLQPYADKGRRLTREEVWPVKGDEQRLKEKSLHIDEKNLKRLAEFREREKLKNG